MWILLGTLAYVDIVYVAILIIQMTGSSKFAQCRDSQCQPENISDVWNPYPEFPRCIRYVHQKKDLNVDAKKNL